MDRIEQKQHLRKVLREQTLNLPKTYIEESDSGIRNHLLTLNEWVQARTVFIYISMGREPDTRTIIRDALNAGKTVAVPRCLENGEMEARAIPSLHGLNPGQFGSPEPDTSYSLLLPNDFDCIVAPCMAADRQGYRLGHGGGYYDRYLAKVHCPVVCLCRERLMQAALPHETFDRPADIVITEQACIKII